VSAGRRFASGPGAKGGAADDIGRLNRGEFYFSTEATGRPIKIRTPLCRTWHPANPLPAEEVVAKAHVNDAALTKLTRRHCVDG
jgi:hypothetical protein